MSDDIKALANSMISRKKSNVNPYILFLGAGASISSECSSMMQIVDDVLGSNDSKQFGEWEKNITDATAINFEYGELKKEEINGKKRDQFFKIWRVLDRDSQYAILRKHLWENKEPSNGYVDLVHLIDIGHIKVILSTNLDNLLEKALNKAGLYQPDDFIVIVNGKDKPEEIREQLESDRGQLKLIKLHGTLESPKSYAFTPEEVFDFEKTIKPYLSQIINQSLVIIGHSMQDRDLDMLFDDEGKEIHFIRPTPPETESRIDTILKVRRRGNIIKGEDGKFDVFFQKLKLYIEKDSNEKKKSNVLSIEGFLRSIGYDHELEVPRSRFRNLPTLYIKPTEYSDICSKLEREHVVFIIGEPHLGKTYTAFYLLWKYYQKGYETSHIRHDKLVTLLHQYDGDMKKLLLSLFANKKEHHIIHFDDPFGETMERRTDAFAKELNTFLDLAQGYEHIRIIVTSRLNIFRESMALAHTRLNIKELEKDIRVHTSYRRDILLDILHRYIQFYKPLWAADEKIIAALNEQLPDLLPAPHNIEFFVRTSERFDSLEDVLNHVENSKEMIKALGDWMASLSDHEQFFLILLEVCSSTSILFPNTPTSKMDFENTYKETLAYLFKHDHIAGIPTNPFSRAKDKFDMIILENRDKDVEFIKYDFVHPSYHEAFWNAIQRKLSLHLRWLLLKDNIDVILKELENKVDLVQLRMIERYGSINRDLDQLLLFSAESSDSKEQMIAFGHMLERPEKFIHLPHFSNCASSAIASKKLMGEIQKGRFLDIIENYFDQLPFDILKTVPAFVFDTEPRIRLKSEKIILKYFDKLPDLIKQCETMQDWKALNNIVLPPEKRLFKDEQDIITLLSESIDFLSKDDMMNFYNACKNYDGVLNSTTLLTRFPDVLISQLAQRNIESMRLKINRP